MSKMTSEVFSLETNQSMSAILRNALCNLDIKMSICEGVNFISHENIGSLCDIVKNTFNLENSDNSILAVPLKNSLESAALILFAFFTDNKILALDLDEDEKLRQEKLDLFPNHILIKPDELKLNTLNNQCEFPVYELDHISFTETFLVTFTSGSTGKPKAVLHNRASIINCSISFGEAFGCNSQNVFGNFMPLHYMAGIFNGVFVPILNRSKVIIFPQFNIHTAVKFNKFLDKYAITDAWLSPSMVSIINIMDRTRNLVQSINCRMLSSALGQPMKRIV